MSDRPFEDEVSLAALQRRSKEVSDAVAEIGAASLMSEDLEKNRNLLAILTGISLAIGLIKVGTIDLFGVKFDYDCSAAPYMMFAILFATMVVGFQYRARYILDKASRLTLMLEIRRMAEEDREHLEHLFEIRERILKAPGTDPYLRDLERAAEAIKHNRLKMQLAESGLRQNIVVAYLPYFLVAAQSACIGLVTAKQWMG